MLLGAAPQLSFWLSCCCCLPAAWRLYRHGAHGCRILACCASLPTQVALTMSFCCGSCQMPSQLFLHYTYSASLGIPGPRCHQFHVVI